MDNNVVPLIDITGTSPKEWKYVSEGGATIVFSYTGQNPDFDSKVLRLRKTSSIPTNGQMRAAGMLEIYQASETNHKDDLEPDDPMIVFQHTVMERLVSPEHLPRLMPIRVGHAWLLSLAELCQLERPHDRRLHDHIDIGRTKAVIATDLVGDDGLVVEIKPKWAFLPSPTHLSPATLPVKTKMCRFCMHSHYKSQTGDFIPRSYCPLDLFSGDDLRIKKALCNLWDSWFETKGTGNNLRVFVHGLMIKPIDGTSLNSLTEELGFGDANLDPLVLRDRFVSVIMPPLVNTRVLHTLSKLQRSLDALDIEGLSRLWSLAHLQLPNEVSSTLGGVSENLSLPGSITAEPSIADWTAFVDDYLSSHSSLDHSQPQTSNLRYYVLAYLLSATFKDCSIMIRANQVQGSGTTQETRGSSVTVIDLDPKSIRRLRKWEKLDKEISESCIGLEARNCVDGWKDD